MKKIFVYFFALIMILTSLTGCRGDKDANKIKIGVSMPSKESFYQNQDGNTIKAVLDGAGYRTLLQYAGDDSSVQASQIKYMIDEGCRVIMINPVDSDALSEVLAEAAANNICVISYDRLIENSDAVSYYVTFDESKPGYLEGKYIADALKLDECPENQSYTLEIFAGSEDDEISKRYYEDAMQILRPYIESGVLKVTSGDIEYEDVIEKADDADSEIEKRTLRYVEDYYSDELILDAILCTTDDVALRVENVLDYNYCGNFPVITGSGCNLDSVRNIIDEKQTMSVFRNTKLLADAAVDIINSVINNTEVPVDDTETFNNGLITVPTYVCEPDYVDYSNYKEKLIDSGYYSEEQLRN